MNRGRAFDDFDAIRPHVMALLELHRAAQTDEARANVVMMLEDAFLAAVWHASRDLVAGGWSPGASPPARSSGRPRLRLVGGTDAA